MIIAITGENGVGKDTVGMIIQYLTTSVQHFYTFTDFINKEVFPQNTIYNFGSPWYIKKFADLPVKQYKELTGIDFHSLSREEKEKERKNFILFAEGIKKTFKDKSIWAKRLISQYKPVDKGIANRSSILFENCYYHPSCKHCKKEYYGYKKQYLCENCIEDDSVQFYPKWIITDLRFPEEEKILPADTIYISVLKSPQIQAGYIGKTSDDVLFPKTTAHIINNTSTIEDLVISVATILKLENIIE